MKCDVHYSVINFYSWLSHIYKENIKIIIQFCMSSPPPFFMLYEACLITSLSKTTREKFGLNGKSFLCTPIIINLDAQPELFLGLIYQTAYSKYPFYDVKQARQIWLVHKSFTFHSPSISVNGNLILPVRH